MPKIEEKRINILKKIGNGAFGEVYYGTIYCKENKEIEIAIKVKAWHIYFFIFQLKIKKFFRI